MWFIRVFFNFSFFSSSFTFVMKPSTTHLLHTSLLLISKLFSWVSSESMLSSFSHFLVWNFTCVLDLLKWSILLSSSYCSPSLYFGSSTFFFFLLFLFVFGYLILYWTLHHSLVVYPLVWIFLISTGTLSSMISLTLCTLLFCSVLLVVYEMFFSLSNILVWFQPLCSLFLCLYQGVWSVVVVQFLNVFVSLYWCDNYFLGCVHQIFVVLLAMYFIACLNPCYVQYYYMSFYFPSPCLLYYP